MPDMAGVEQLAFTKLLENHSPFAGFDLDHDSWGKCGCGKSMHYESWFLHVIEEWLNL